MLMPALTKPRRLTTAVSPHADTNTTNSNLSLGVKSIFKLLIEAETILPAGTIPE